MPKIIELTVEIVVQKVSCPGVWLCQDGSVSLIVFALGTNYETCMLPPTFPLVFNDKFYFRKRFPETCALNNIGCLLRDETLYCELVQWCQNCAKAECNILAQYLGSLSEVLFPPKMCCSDGVDLLMRRSKKYPGILAPKIEIATKVRIDEVWNDCYKPTLNVKNIRTCYAGSESRQKPVCHSAEYHRNKCPAGTRPDSNSRSNSRSRSHSRGSESCSSLKAQRTAENFPCASCPSRHFDRACNSGPALPCPGRRRNYYVYKVEVPKGDHLWNTATGNASHENDDDNDSGRDKEQDLTDSKKEKVLLESRHINDDGEEEYKEHKPCHTVNMEQTNVKPCVCEICRRYHDLFHTDAS